MLGIGGPRKLDPSVSGNSGQINNEPRMAGYFRVASRHLVPWLESLRERLCLFWIVFRPPIRPVSTVAQGATIFVLPTNLLIKK